MTQSIFLPAQVGPLSLQNRFVMSPMTRSRAKAEGVPSALAATYYEQRASAGLIITEGTAPSPNGRGYARIPGLWSDAQVEGWRSITQPVHEKGAKFFAQLMHTGRVSHPLNMPKGARVMAPSAVRLEGTQMWTDEKQLQDYPVPQAMTESDVEATIQEHVVAAKNAIRAGFDGVELHAANGYLTEQFLNPGTNRRSDRYGGSIAGRARFGLDVVRAMVAVIGKDRVGIRVSPYGVANGMTPYSEIDDAYAYLADELSKIQIAFIHVVDHSAIGAPAVPHRVKEIIRSRFKGVYIAAGGFDLASAQKAIDSKAADLIAFGRPFLANPDLVARLKNGWPLNPANMKTAYTPGPEGYIDYPHHGN